MKVESRHRVLHTKMWLQSTAIARAVVITHRLPLAVAVDDGVERHQHRRLDHCSRSSRCSCRCSSPCAGCRSSCRCSLAIVIADHQAERNGQLPARAVSTDDDARPSCIEAELSWAGADLLVDLKHIVLSGWIRSLGRPPVHGSEHAEAGLSGDESAGALVRFGRADGVASTVNEDAQRSHFCSAKMLR